MVDFTLFSFHLTAGRLCEWKPKTTDKYSDVNSFEEYLKTLELHCEPGNTALLNWTVAMDTPDLLYYQVKNYFAFFFKSNYSMNE